MSTYTPEITSEAKITKSVQFGEVAAPFLPENEYDFWIFLTNVAHYGTIGPGR